MPVHQLLLINILLYLGAFLFFLKKYKWNNLSTILFGYYLISASCSYLYYIFPLYIYTITAEGIPTAESMLYLFCINFLLCSSVRNVNLANISKITYYNKKVFNNIQYFLLIVFTLILLFEIPIRIDSFFSGTNLGDLRNETYDNIYEKSNFFIISILNRFFGGTKILLLFISMFNICILKQNKRINYYGLAVYALLLILTMFTQISRAIILFNLLELVLVYCLFKDYITDKLKKLTKRSILMVLPTLVFFFTIISLARFDSGEQMANQFASLRYAGEAQLNFMGLMYDKTSGCTNGYMQFPLFRRVLGLNYIGGLGNSKDKNLEPIDKIHPYPNFIFYQLTGSWYLDFGKWGTLFIAFIIFLSFNFIRNRQISFTKLFTGFLLSSMFAQGIFFGPFGTESGNFLFLFLAIIAIYLKLNKHISIKI